MINIPLAVASSFFACVLAFYAEPLVVAHRGASRDAPENTLAAFKLAWEQGADAIEGDFLLTKDNKIVCIHDKSTERLAERKLLVRESPLAQLHELDVGLHKGEKFKDTKIPTIDEVFATIPAGKKIFIEIKCGKEIIPPLLEEIKKSELMDEQVAIICFNAEVIRLLKTSMEALVRPWPCKRTIVSFSADCDSSDWVGLEVEQLIMRGSNRRRTQRDIGFIFQILCPSEKSRKALRSMQKLSGKVRFVKNHDFLE